MSQYISRSFITISEYLSQFTIAVVGKKRWPNFGIFHFNGPWIGVATIALPQNPLCVSFALTKLYSVRLALVIFKNRMKP